MLDLTQYLGILIYALIGCALIGGIYLISYFIREKGSDPLRRSTYECGMQTIGTPYVSPNIRFYVFALIFVIFDLEAVFIYPWAVKFKELGWVGFVEMVLFVGILLVPFVYAWKKGALRWE